MIGLFWMGHHSIFRYITALDRPVIAINLVFLGFVAFLPYPTSLLGSGNGPDRVATIFYSACISCAGLGELAIWLYAATPGISWSRGRPRRCAATWRCGSRACRQFSCCPSRLP